MPESLTPQAGSATPTGPLDKAARLDAISFPYLPAFPLDSDVLDDLAHYPGEVPKSLPHFLALIKPTYLPGR
jgi:hypothetical protein